MNDTNATETRRYTFEQIRAEELARGASEDDAARTAASMVDAVMAREAGDKK